MASGVDNLSVLDTELKCATSGKWYVIEDEAVDSVWIATDEGGNEPIALLDYGSRDENSANARLIVDMKNCVHSLVSEIRSLRSRVVELLSENANEVNLRIKLQSEYGISHKK